MLARAMIYLTRWLTIMNAMLNLLLEHPRAVLAAGVVIPCGLWGLIEREDDEAITMRVAPRSAAHDTAPSNTKLFRTEFSA